MAFDPEAADGDAASVVAGAAGPSIDAEAANGCGSAGEDVCAWADIPAAIAIPLKTTADEMSFHVVIQGSPSGFFVSLPPRNRALGCDSTHGKD